MRDVKYEEYVKLLNEKHRGLDRFWDEETNLRYKSLRYVMQAALREAADTYPMIPSSL